MKLKLQAAKTKSEQLTLLKNLQQQTAGASFKEKDLALTTWEHLINYSSQRRKKKQDVCGKTTTTVWRGQVVVLPGNQDGKKHKRM